ncbi:hypothetical protein E2C01_039411 [Portunus trituberculatus]|uniref:Uncharacterized protein n=1 Tax=Portunus trituberculatus TaxID=210409 RepID=A0A5B7FJM5_PORTR|nr:hypothetical protein [Portunus trituberculatus]
MSARLAIMAGSAKDSEQAWAAMNTMEQRSSVSAWVNAHHETPRFNLTNVRQTLKQSCLQVRVFMGPLTQGKVFECVHGKVESRGTSLRSTAPHPLRS